MARRSKASIVMLAILLVAACISACGQKEADWGEIESTGEREPYDLSAEKWNGYEEIVDSDKLWVPTDYWEYLEPEMFDDTLYYRQYSATDGLDYYVLYSHAVFDDDIIVEETLYLTHLNLLTLEVTTTKFSPFDEQDALGDIVSGLPELAEAVGSRKAFIRGLDVLDGKLCLLVVRQDQESKAASHAYAVHMDDSLKAEKVTDLTSGLQQAGILGDAIAPDGIRCDRDGRIYVGTFRIAVMDAGGMFLKMLECPGSLGSAVLCTGRLSNGVPLFESVDSESGDTVIFILDSKKEKVLFREQGLNSQIRYVNSYGEILSLQGGQLLLWDVPEGSCRRLYQDVGLMGFTCDMVTETSDGEIIIVYYDKEGFYCSKLKPETDTEETLISVQAIWRIGPKLERAAAEYSRKHPGVRIELICPEQEDKGEIAMNKLMAQLSVGQGPDILILHRDEMLLLQEKGALADLSELLPQELLDQIFPGVLQYGMANGRIWGLAYEAGIDTLLISEDLWKGDTWTARDVMGLMEEREAVGEPVAWLSGQEVSPDSMLYKLAIQDVEAGTSSLVDMEGKQCRFDTEEFVRILEFCREHGQNAGSYEHISSKEHADQIHNGGALAYSVSGNLADFSEAMTALGDGYKCIGYPTDSGFGNYVYCSECLAVTAATEKYEIACDFLEYLMSERVQRTTMSVSSVRRDIFMTYVVEEPGSSREPRFIIKKRHYFPLTGRPDGRSFLPEYMQIMEKGTSGEEASGQIRRIVSEEAGAYFAGDKSAEEAAEIIQRRVWLYLNE